MERKPFPSETQERFIVRFPDGMRDRIADAAKANNRSMNAEIIARLKESFGDRPTRAEFNEAHERGHQLLAESWSKEAIEHFEKLATKAGEAAATRVLQAKGLDAMHVGTPSIVQTPAQPKRKK